MRKRTLLRFGLPTFVVAAALVIVLGLQTRATPHETLEMTAPTALASADDHELARVADAVFVGRVDDQSGTQMIGESPYTRFRVTVVQVIKGSLGTAVEVSQLGGVDASKHRRVVVTGDSPLETDHVYLISARRASSGAGLVVVPVHGHVDLTADVANPRALTAESARSIPRVARMRAAVDLSPVA